MDLVDLKCNINSFCKNNSIKFECAPQAIDGLETFFFTINNYNYRTTIITDCSYEYSSICSDIINNLIIILNKED